MKLLIVAMVSALALGTCAEKVLAHDIHISYSQAEMHGSDLIVRVSYYKDDYTTAVKNWYKGSLSEADPARFKDAEFEYLKNFFRVWVGGYSNQVLPILDKLTDDGTSVIFELRFSSVSRSSLIIDQRVLFKEYGEQMNIFFIKAFGKENNHIFTLAKPTFRIDP